MIHTKRNSSGNGLNNSNRSRVEDNNDRCTNHEICENSEYQKASISSSPQDRAREWLTYLYSGHTTATKRDEFVVWLNSSDENKQAFTRSQKVWQTIGMTDSAVEWMQQHAAQQPATVPKAKPTRVLAKSLMALSAMAASVALLVFNGVFNTTTHLTLPQPQTAFTSPVGQNRHITLSDGSDITLAGNSSILVAITDDERRITLRKGSAYFDVSHDPSRVFSVTAQQTQVRVRGTAFEVKYSPNNSLKISVQRGLVDVADLPETAEQREQVLQLRPNEQLHTDIQGRFISPITVFQPETEFAWLKQRLIYDNVPLKNVIMDINRYVKKPVIILDNSINELPITASFTFEQIEPMLDGLASAYPITLTHEATRSVLTEE